MKQKPLFYKIIHYNSSKDVLVIYKKKGAAAAQLPPLTPLRV
jgi:hypothetical protein